MKLASLAFLAVLGWLHWATGSNSAAALPLSMFRDGEQATLGYVAFLLLAALGLLMLHASVKSLQVENALFYGLATVLLIIVAATPSLDGLHLLWSLVLPFLFYVYYARLLIAADSLWLFAHLVVPAAIVILTRSHSFGAWQKCLIVYFVCVVTIHHHLLSGLIRAGCVDRARRIRSLRRKVLYAVTPGKAWVRQTVRS